MSKIISVIGVIVFLLLSWLLVDTYVTAREPLIEEQTVAEERLLNAHSFAGITERQTYYGETTVHVFKGMLDGESHIAWVPASSEEDILVKQTADGVDKKTIIDTLKADGKPEKILDIRLGLRNQQPVWRAVYIAEDQRQYYEYYSFQDGTFLESISLKRS
ncbi:hypothetical protein G4V62_01695 [Bacillaceae bacterium SIJ1]|uniref:hypothetical protein n=1 Tax=Litoribacterium kuwaitense TaxID=1398745 RepID=UPI0013EA78B9|nr:hypothetical protein [Litoribacterium kuwaitense]NGP43740.1 hypothetical protein [Litoribacterium kuwaitense]